jgi:hypothetical protein
MVFIPGPPGLAKVRITWTQAGHQAQNVMHWRKDGAWATLPAELELVTEQFIHAYSPGDNSGPLAGLSVSCHLTQIEVVDVVSEDGVGTIRTLDLAGHNSDADAAPPGVAMVIAESTLFRGRSNRGRIFQMGIPAGHVNSGGGLNGAELTNWQGLWNTWLTKLGDGDSIAGSLVVASYQHNGLGRSVAVTNEVTAVTVRPSVHSQRRRYD